MPVLGTNLGNKLALQRKTTPTVKDIRFKENNAEEPRKVILANSWFLAQLWANVKYQLAHACAGYQTWNKHKTLKRRFYRNS